MDNADKKLMNNKVIDYIFHFIAYYFAWFSAIFLAANNQNSLAVLTVIATVFFQIIWQLYMAKRTQGLWLMMTLFFVFGTLADTLVMKAGLIEFAANPFGNYLSAPWMSSLWLSFAITFYSLLPSFFDRYFLVGVLSLISFPVAYSAGAALHAAQLPHGYISSFLIGVIWAILFPLILKIYHGLEH